MRAAKPTTPPKKLGPLITAEDLGKLFSLTTRRIQQLAAEGALPRAVKGRWETVAAIMAMGKWFQRDGDEMKREKLQKLKAERELKQEELAERRGETMPVATARPQAGEAAGHFMNELERWGREMPPTLAGLSAVEVSKVMNARQEQVRKSLMEKLNTIAK